MKSYWLNLGLLSALLGAGVAAGCSSDSTTAVSAEAGSAGEASSVAGKSSGSAGKSAGTAGSTQSNAGSPGELGSGEGGAAGSVGATDSAGSAGSAGDAGQSGEAGAMPSGGTAGSGGSAVSGGSAGTAGSGGTSGGGAGGAANNSNSSASAGTGGAPPTLYIPASTTCAAGNVLAAYAVCRNCHGNPLSTTTTPPFMLVTYADVTAHAADEYVQVSAGVMPLPVAGIAFGASSTCSAGGTKPCKNVLLDWLSAGAVGVPALNGVCP